VTESVPENILAVFVSPRRGSHGEVVTRSSSTREASEDEVDHFQSISRVRLVIIHYIIFFM